MALEPRDTLAGHLRSENELTCEKKSVSCVCISDYGQIASDAGEEEARERETSSRQADARASWRGMKSI